VLWAPLRRSRFHLTYSHFLDNYLVDSGPQFVGIENTFRPVGADASHCWASVRVRLDNLHAHEMSEFVAVVAYRHVEDEHVDFQWSCWDPR